MDHSLLIELFGYLGSALVVLSMLMSSVLKLRIINTVGSTISAIYALIIRSFPLALMNLCLIVINVYNLVRLLKSDRAYDLIETAPEDSFLRYFLNRCQEDIRTFFPHFPGEPGEVDRAFLVCCNGTPAGVLLGRMEGGETLDILIDYSTPAFRDCSVGTYLYGQLPGLGIRTLLFRHLNSGEHLAYLEKMGYTPTAQAYIRNLP